MTITTYLSQENTLTDLASDNHFIQTVKDNPEAIKSYVKCTYNLIRNSVNQIEVQLTAEEFLILGSIGKIK